MRWPELGAGLLLVACDGGGGYVYMDDDLPSENCPDTDASQCATSSGDGSSGSTGSTTSGSESGATAACDASLDCEAGFCVAPFDGELGEFACVPECIGIMDEASWCADATACCDASAACTDRGYCVPSDGGGSESGSGDGSTGA